MLDLPDTCRHLIAEEFDFAARSELLKAEEIAEHFANDKLTPEEWPEYGLYERAKRFDNGAVGATGDNIAAAIRRLAE